MSDPHLVAQDVEELIRLAGRFQERGQHEQAADLLLLALYRELGIRQEPVIAFLSRGNPLNMLLGRIRNGFR